MSDDDWMNPETSAVYTYTPPTGVEWEIQRKRAIITFGSPVYRWDHWATFKTEEEMWAALDVLRNDHPSWYLRGRRRNHDMERMGIYPDDDDMERAYELFRRKATRRKATP